MSRRLSPALWAVALAGVSAAGAQTLPSALGPDAAVRIALEARREVQASQQETAAREGLVRQAGFRPNPTLSVQTENWRAWGSPGFQVGDQIDAFLFASQRIETAGKRRKRVASAEADRAVAERETELVRWRISRAVTRAWWQAWAAAERVRSLAGAVETAEELVRYQRARVEQGAAAEVELVRVRVERERAAAELVMAELAAERARIELLGAMGVEPAGADFALREPDSPPGPPAGDIDAWTALAFQQRPEVKVQRAVVAGAESDIVVEQAAARPDVTPYVGYKRANGFNTLVGGLSVPLTIFDRNQGATAASTARHEAERERLRAVQAQVRAEVAAAAETVERRAELLGSLEQRVVAGAEEAYQISLAAYREQAMELVSLLDTQRSLQQARLLYTDAAGAYQLAVVDLETALGAPVEEGE